MGGGGGGGGGGGNPRIERLVVCDGIKESKGEGVLFWVIMLLAAFFLFSLFSPPFFLLHTESAAHQLVLPYRAAT